MTDKKGDSMPIKWRKIADEKPRHNQWCVTKTRHGIIQGQWSKFQENFAGYYTRDMTWWAPEWVPIEEVDDDA